ncbi:F0F1 ATP synthase subunit B [Salipiger mucosus]|uniref:ATP synthase subunit b n=1 Tax=Salipiger mucosus DSM 16094 TaxID=1123237 RepID=S9QDS5_9RHOB|nr:F0F1 ATP synthase subunit B [Salipiger mucosus]EPX79571.1 ATP synthase B chain [Salipiger mucosus DSM 16094]
MRKLIFPAAAATLGTPAMAASGPFFSLGNTDFVVLLAFLLFLAVLVYFKVPGLLGKMLDKRATDIRGELDEARGLREEAQALLASYERKQREVQEQADRIVSQAKSEAELSAAQAKKDLEASIARRMAAAEDQIASAEAAAIRDVRDQAAAVAVAASKDVIAQQMTPDQRAQLVDRSIDEVGAKLH